VKLLKINKSKKENTFALKYDFKKHFTAVIKIYRNYFIALAIADR